ncbi:MAG: M48 family metalloprotease [Immundisolibacteraceae bacterium]|nr:M48 family metalloprotease [Immundisolibacteraceae bacterium]
MVTNGFRWIVAGLLVATSLSSYAVDLNKLFGSAEQGGVGLGSLVGKLVEANNMSPQKEQEVGRHFSAVLLGSAPLLQDPAIQNYVNRVGRWLTLQTERSAQPWRFGVLDTPTVNAFATPGGNVFITRGLLVRLRNETELAGVLGHEIAHVILAHHVKAIRQGAFLDVGANLLKQKLDEKNEMLSAQLSGAVKTIYSRGLDKGAEYQADKLGVVIAARGGYDPYGLPAVIQTLEATQQNDVAFALLFKTHPSPEKRLTALLPAMQKITHLAGSSDLNGNFPKLAKYGDNHFAGDPLVRSIQSELARLGYNPGPADGQFGQRSGDAIRAYQQVNSLLVDGQVSQPLLAHLQRNGNAAPGAAAGLSLAAPVTKPASVSGQVPQAQSAGSQSKTKPQALVIQIQAMLAQKGFNPGIANGLITPQTQVAIMTYQQRNRLTVDGLPSNALLNHLMSNGGSALAPPATDPANSTVDPVGQAAGALVNELFKGFGRQ